MIEQSISGPVEPAVSISDYVLSSTPIQRPGPSRISHPNPLPVPSPPIVQEEIARSLAHSSPSEQQASPFMLNNNYQPVCYRHQLVRANGLKTFDGKALRWEVFKRIFEEQSTIESRMESNRNFVIKVDR